ncbi:MAG: SPOR domain-containing protein [Pseudomonadota bacterium]
MRSIFFFLLVLNVVFGIWHLAFGEKSGTRTESIEQQIALSHVNAPELQLVADTQNDTRSRESQVPQDYAANEMCWKLGPFEESELASNIQTRLRATGVDLFVQKIATPVAPDYWVYAVPMETRQAAVELLRNLQQRNVDSFIIAEGELENGISLGFYSKEKTAREVVEEHLGQDYRVAMQVVPRNIEEYWGVVRAREFDKLSEEAWERFRSDNGDLALEQKYCDFVATAGNFE